MDSAQQSHLMPNGERESQGLRPGGFSLLLSQYLVDGLVYGEQGNDVLLVKYLDPAYTPRSPASKEVNL
jgi:hypothetical protein